MRLNDFRLTEHFRLIEFQCPCCHAVLLSPQLVRKLEALRALAGGPIIVTSGYRCETHNLSVGGVPRSAHIYGRAADVAVLEKDQRRFKEAALSVGFTKAIIYPARNFVHLEISEG